MTTREARDESGVLAGVPMTLPATTRALKLQKRAARVGLDWPDPAGVLDKVREELAELETLLDGRSQAADLEVELGDLIFSVINLARHLGVDPERALRLSNGKFKDRVEYIELRLAADAREIHACSSRELDDLWQEAKRQGL